LEEREYYEGVQSEAFSNPELSSDKKLKKITFKVKSNEENHEESSLYLLTTCSLYLRISF